MKSLIIAGATTLMAIVATSQWKYVPEKAAIKFKVYTHKNEVEAEGAISGLKGGAVLDTNNLSTANITATVDVKTINSGIEMRDESLRSADFFEANKYPQITFTSKEITKVDGVYFANGTLTIKDVSKAVKIPFTASKQNDSEIMLIGNFSINRLDYKVGSKGDGVGTKVEIQLSVPIIK